MKSLFTLLVLTAPAFAATLYILPGTAEYGSWDLNSTNYNNTTVPSYPSSGFASLPWAAPIPASATSATFNRLTGDGYFIGSGSGVYESFGTGSYVFADASPLADLSNLLLQTRQNVDPTSVLLSFNGLNQQISPTYSAVDPGVGYSDYAWQWDLRTYAGTIDHYEIVIDAQEHNIFYGNEPGLTTITASNTFAQAIPEPSSTLLGAVAIGFALIRRRRA